MIPLSMPCPLVLRVAWAALWLVTATTGVAGQLVVNVRNNGGDVYTERIEANTTTDSILLDFRKADGTLITQLIDGRNEVNIFKVVILPEEERSQTLIQTFCFVSRFSKNDFIASDAMSKLRQKNPSAVRHPEEQRPDELYQFDARLDVVSAGELLSPHVASVCAEAHESSFIRMSDLKLLAQIRNRAPDALQSVARALSISEAAPSRCTEVSELGRACLCRYDLCVGWYPCGLKYCRGKDSAGRVVSYRCGIKTCSRCRGFEWRSPAKRLCLWDEPEFSLPEDEEAVDEGGAEGDKQGGKGAEGALQAVQSQGIVEGGFGVADGTGGGGLAPLLFQSRNKLPEQNPVVGVVRPSVGTKREAGMLGAAVEELSPQGANGGVLSPLGGLGGLQNNQSDVRGAAKQDEPAAAAAAEKDVGVEGPMNDDEDGE